MQARRPKAVVIVSICFAHALFDVFTALKSLLTASQQGDKRITPPACTTQRVVAYLVEVNLQ